MKQYLDIMQRILDNGIKSTDRTGTGTLQIFGTQCRYNLEDGFPLVTTKKVYLKGIIYELLWFLSGNTNIDYLKSHNVHIWDEWADEKGDLGPVYGAQWRNWSGLDGMGRVKVVDQVKNLIDLLTTNPESRRAVISAWNPSQIDDMALPPCHCMFQFCVRGEYLDLQLYQRSADWFLGVPFNIASYSLLLMMVANCVGLKPGEFIHTTGCTHLYLNHIEQAKLQLSRTPKKLGIMEINPEVKDIFGFVYEDFKLTGYDPWPAIKADVSV